MFRKHPQQIEKLVLGIVRNSGLETPLLQRRAMNLWDEVAGPLVAQYTTEKRIDNQTLCVKIQNPALRSELAMRKSELVRQINQRVGAQVICDIRL